MKTCTKCKVEKELKEFIKNKNNNGGLLHQCKSCVKVYRESNKDKAKAWRKANKDEINAKRKIYEEANKDKVNAYQKAYREANKDKAKAYDQVYRKANRGERNARLRERAKTDKALAARLKNTGLL